jgi:hypothetical protein
MSLRKRSIVLIHVRHTFATTSALIMSVLFREYWSSLPQWTKFEAVAVGVVKAYGAQGVGVQLYSCLASALYGDE